MCAASTLLPFQPATMSTAQAGGGVLPGPLRRANHTAGALSTTVVKAHGHRPHRPHRPLTTCPRAPFSLGAPGLQGPFPFERPDGPLRRKPEAGLCLDRRAD